MKLDMDDPKVTPSSYQFRANRFVENSTLPTGVNENLAPPLFFEFSSHVDKIREIKSPSNADDLRPVCESRWNGIRIYSRVLA
jgi:hypothetical protein